MGRVNEAIYIPEVVPGVLSTMAVVCWVRALMHVDFPAFISPNRPMSRRVMLGLEVVGGVLAVVLVLLLACLTCLCVYMCVYMCV